MRARAWDERTTPAKTSAPDNMLPSPVHLQDFLLDSGIAKDRYEARLILSELKDRYYSEFSWEALEKALMEFGHDFDLLEDILDAIIDVPFKVEEKLYPQSQREEGLYFKIGLIGPAVYSARLDLVIEYIIANPQRAVSPELVYELLGDRPSSPTRYTDPTEPDYRNDRYLAEYSVSGPDSKGGNVSIDGSSAVAKAAPVRSPRQPTLKMTNKGNKPAEKHNRRLSQKYPTPETAEKALARLKNKTESSIKRVDYDLYMAIKYYIGCNQTDFRFDPPGTFPYWIRQEFGIGDSAASTAALASI